MTVTIYPKSGDPIVVSAATSVQAGTFVSSNQGGAPSVDLYNGQGDLIASFNREAINGYVIGGQCPIMQHAELTADRPC